MSPFRFLLIVGLLTAALSAIALAQDVPCAYTDNRTRVSCTIDGFNAIKTTCVQHQAEREKCGIRLSATEQSLTDMTNAHRACLESIPPAPVPRSVWPARIGFLLTAVGTAALTAGPLASDLSIQSRAVLVSGGLGALFSGYWLVSLD